MEALLRSRVSNRFRRVSKQSSKMMHRAPSTDLGARAQARKRKAKSEERGAMTEERKTVSKKPEAAVCLSTEKS